jgi:hypothetical protein
METNMLNAPASRLFTTGALRRTVIEYAVDLCGWQRTELSRRHRTDDNYAQRRPFTVHGPDDVRGLTARAEVLVSGLLEDFPAAASGFAERFNRILPVLGDNGSGPAELREQFNRLFGLEDPDAEVSGGAFRIDVTEEGVRVSAAHGADFLESVSAFLSASRDSGAAPTADEKLAVRLAYTAINDGEQLRLPAKPWGSPGFRDVQTYMSVTDPGEGHLLGTTRERSYLDGVIVHVEHLERGIEQSREEVEPYRIPIPRVISRVRLHTGLDAPVSSYVGRPMFEGSVRDSMLKTVHTTAAACSALFADGITECKLAIERMTATEAVEFMGSIVGNVRRNRHRQVLSAAFNLNTPLVDDRSETMRANGGRPLLVQDRFAIGSLGIELAAAAGFDKVTWDGTADTYPSRCVIEQLAFEQAVTLVHRAHEAGLLTYFSAGFRFGHLADITWTGTDGVGVGGAQILRFMDKKTGHHGPFKPENIAEILRHRDAAAEAVLGRGAVALARLDQMFFEKSITVELDAAREELFLAQALRDEAAVAAVLERIGGVATAPAADELPVLASARRLLEAGHRSLAAAAHTEEDWARELGRLERAVKAGDADWAAELLAAARTHLVEAAARIDATVAGRFKDVAREGRAIAMKKGNAA